MCVRERESLSHVQLFVTVWTAAPQAPLSMGFSRQEYWSGLLFPSPGYLPRKHNCERDNNGFLWNGVDWTYEVAVNKKNEGEENRTWLK